MDATGYRNFLHAVITQGCIIAKQLQQITAIRSILCNLAHRLHQLLLLEKRASCLLLCSQFLIIWLDMCDEAVSVKAFCYKVHNDLS